MPNSLNITTTNFAKNSDKAWLYDPAVYVDFRDGNGELPIGVTDKEKTWSQAVEYAQLTEGIPESLLRKDIIKQSFILDLKLKQIQAETVALLSQRYLDTGVSGYKRVLMGSGIPVPVFPSVILVGQTVDGLEAKLYIRRAQISAEDFQMLLGGSEYASIPLKLEALVDDDPMGNQPDWDYIGKNTVSATVTDEDATLSAISFGTVDDIKVGGHISGDGIPDETTVDSVDYTGTEIEMSAAATASDTGVTITVECENTLTPYDNIAFWKFEQAA